VLVYLSLWGYSTFAGRAPLTRGGGAIPGDYVAFYTAGRMLLNGEGNLLFDPLRVRQAQGETMGFLVPDLYDAFRNPPFVAIPFAPLALLDLLPSFAVWTLANLACLGIAIWLALETLPALRAHWRAISIIAFSFEPVYRGLAGGQNEGVSLLLYVLIYRTMRAGHEPRAGAWAALGLFKPQLFLLFPLVFLAARRWRALGTYVVVAALLAILSVAVVGLDGVWSWPREILNYEGGNALKNAYRMHSSKTFFDQLLAGAQPALSLVLYLVTSTALLGLLVRVWAKPRSSLNPDHLALRWALTSVVAVLVDPHLVDYDLVVLILTGLLLGATVASARWWIFGAYVALLATLAFDVALPWGGQLQLTVPLFLGFVAWSWRRLAPLRVPAQTKVRVLVGAATSAD
jgi:hypothetical protein